MRLLLMSLSWVRMACEISSMSILIPIAAGNHDFDFGTLEQSLIVLRLLKKAFRISASLHINSRHQVCG